MGCITSLGKKLGLRSTSRYDSITSKRGNAWKTNWLFEENISIPQT